MPRFKGKKMYFNKRDTYDLSCTLDPIICEGLKRFKEVITTDKPAKEWSGVPSLLLAKLYPLEEGEYHHTDEQLDQGKIAWLSILDEMIYAFDNKEPDIAAYKFDYVPSEGHEEETEDGYFRWDMRIKNEEEHQRYKEDEKEHFARVEEGRRLFFEYYSCLWW